MRSQVRKIQENFQNLEEPEFELPSPEFGDIGLDEDQRSNLEKAHIESQRALAAVDQSWPPYPAGFNVGLIKRSIDPLELDGPPWLLPDLYYCFQSDSLREDYSHLELFLIESSGAIHSFAYLTKADQRTRVTISFTNGHSPYKSNNVPSQTRTQWKQRSGSELWQLSEYQVSSPDLTTMTNTYQGQEGITTQITVKQVFEVLHSVSSLC